MNRPSDEEMRLSAALNELIGELNCEVMLRSNRREISDSVLTVDGDVDVDCQSAMVAVLSCALELEALEELDMYSRAWIADAKESCDRALEKIRPAHADTGSEVTS